MHDYKHRLRALVNGDRHPIRAEMQRTGGDGEVAVFRLYDAIDSWGGEWGVSAREVAAALDELPASTTEIRLHINSPGGEVFEGIAILNALRSHKARVVAVVDGIAASAASFIAVGADETVMARNAELMIHDAWGLTIGNAQDMRDMADLLDHHSDNIASIYADKTGGDVATWRAAMSAETWYSAEEAVAAGLADQVDKKQTADAKNRYDLTIFTYAGRDQAPAPAAVIPEPPAPPAPSGEETDPDGAPVTLPEPAADEDVELELVARSLEHLARF